VIQMSRSSVENKKGTTDVVPNLGPGFRGSEPGIGCDAEANEADADHRSEANPLR
jgi:hypothetical protein